MTTYHLASSMYSPLRSKPLHRGMHLLAALSMAFLLLIAVYAWGSNPFFLVSPVSAQGENPLASISGPQDAFPNILNSPLAQVGGTEIWHYNLALKGIPPVIGFDGTIYVTDDYLSVQRVLAFSPDAPDILWDSSFVKILALAVGEDGLIYVGGTKINDTGEVFGLNPTTGNVEIGIDLVSTDLGWLQFAIGADGTIYVIASNGSVYALSPTTGTILWQASGGNELVIDQIGNLYLSTASSIKQLSSEGDLEWDISVNSDPLFGISSLAVDVDGSLYATEGSYLHKITPTGSVLWSLLLSYSSFNLTTDNLAIGSGGIVYLTAEWGEETSLDYGLCSIDTLLQTVDWCYATSDPPTPFAIGSDGLIYVADGELEDSTNELYAINPNGTLEWIFDTEIETLGVVPPVVGVETVYFGVVGSGFYAISSSSTGLLDSPWPRYGHDNRGTYRAAAIDSVLLNPFVWNADGECPFSTGAGARGAAGGSRGGSTDTYSGNYSYQQVDLSIPVAGNTLQFRRSYASEAVDTYTTLMGNGWTHNYDMQLHFTNTILSDTVELQAPGGSRLPFFIQPDDTYTPYPGIMAELTYISTTQEYLFTCANQSEYRFNAQGQLLEEEDAFGNLITFDYDTNGQLITATQGTRFLSYQYDANDRLDKVTDHTSRFVELEYDTNGNLTVVTDTLGLATHYEYSGTTPLLNKIIDPSERILEEITYDAQGRSYRQKDGLGNILVQIDYAITPTNSLTQNVVTENDVTTIHSYDRRRTLVDVIYDCTGTTGCGTGQGMAYNSHFKTNYIQDANDNPTYLTWNETGGSSTLEHVRDALGQETFMEYNGNNSLTHVQDARNHDTFYTYDNATFPTFRTSMTDELGNTTIYTPTANGYLWQQRDPNQILTVYNYNTFGQMTRVVQGYGTSDALTTTYRYDDLGRLITTTQTSANESHTTLNVYDPANRLIAMIANWTGSNPVNWENDCDIPAVAADENVCTRYGYDEAGRAISTTNALGQTNLTFYDAAGRVVTSVVNYDDKIPFNELCTDLNNPDPEYNICSLTGYDEYGRVVTTTNSLGHQTVTEYSVLGRVNQTIVNWENGVYNAAYPDTDIITSYEYDAAGNVITTTDALGRKTRTFYDALNRVAGTMNNWQDDTTLADCGSLTEIRDTNICTRYEYDEVGNTIIMTDTLGRMTRTFYDELNRVQVTVANWQTDFTNPLQNCVYAATNNQTQNICTRYGYDAAGRQITVTNALNQTSLTVYDQANRPVVQVTNWDKTTSILPDGTGCADTETNPTASQNLCAFTSYDSLGRRTSTTDVMGVVTTFEYDGLGRVITTTRTADGETFVTVTGYDAIGNRLSQTDAEDHTTTYMYDGLNRLYTTTSPEGVVITQTYNAAGWLIATTNDLENQTTYTYDDLGRRLTVTDPENHTTEYIYDALGNQVGMIDAEGVQTTYVYDGLNRLKQVIENDVTGNVPGPETDVLTQYVYDAIGNRVVITNALGFTSSLTTYDDLNRPIVVEDALRNHTVTAYNALGYQVVMTDGNEAVAQYSYDSLNRLETVNYVADGETVSYLYDARGNTLVMTDSLGLTIYEYDDLGRLLTVTNPFNSVVGYQYNKVGSRVLLIYPDERNVTYVYDDDNRLVQVEDWDEQVTTYEYDDIGRLITTTLPNNVQTVYTYDEADRLIGLMHYNLETSDLLAEYAYELDNIGHRITVTERLLLPGIPVGTAAAPAGVVQKIPTNAAEVLAAIQPHELVKELVMGKRMNTPALALDDLQPPTNPITSTLPLTGGIPLTDTLPFDPQAITEQVENTIQTPPGETPYVAQETHEVLFEAGSITFAAITETAVLSDTTPPEPVTITVELNAPPTLTVALAEIAIGGQPLFIGPDTNVPNFEANIARFDLGDGLTEEFVARNAGVEQRWWLQTNPNLSGDLTIEVEVVTPLTLTIRGNGFVFETLAADSPDDVPVIQYERAVVIDAVGHTYWAHLSAETVHTDANGVHTYRLQMAFPADWLATAEYPLLVDPLISSVLRLGHQSPTGDQTLPQVTYNSVDDEYLIVWQDGRNSGSTGYDIYGQRVGGDGALLGNNFAINSASYDQTEPQVAYGGGQYLVAWKHNLDVSGANNYDVYAARVSNAGQVIDTTPLVVANNTGTYGQEIPDDVVYNSTTGKFLVLWESNSSFGYDILGRRVTSSGGMETIYTIANHSRPERWAKAVYDPENDQFLVVYGFRPTTATQFDIYGKLLSSTGGTTGSTITIAGSSTADQRYPHVAYLPAADRYLVVWQDDRNAATNGYDIYAQKVDTSGGLDGGNYALVSGNAAEERPRLGQGADNTAFLVWQRNNGGTNVLDLYGRLLTDNGQTFADSFTVFSLKANQSMPAVVGDVNGHYLTAWQDDRNTNNDIYARRIVSDGSIGGDFMVHPTPGDQQVPQVAYNPDDDEYLVVWDNFGTDWDLYGQRISGDGELIENNILIAGGSGDQGGGKVAYGGGQYLVAWSASGSTYDVKAVFVSPTGGLGSIIDVAISSTANEGPTDIIYNPTYNKFLVLYDHSQSGNIWGRHVLANESMETAAQLSSAAAQETYGVAAYNPDADEYLLVWQYTVNGSNRDLYAQRANSSLVLQGSNPTQLVTGTFDQRFADVVYLPTANRYLVAWQELTNNLSLLTNIYGQLVTSVATADGSPYTISAQAGDEQAPRIAINNLGSAIVLWHWYQASTGYGIYGRELDSQGQPDGDRFMVLDVENNQQNPAVASNGSTRYLVAWQDNRVSGWDAYAALFQPFQETTITYEYDPLYRLAEADYSGTLNANYQYAYDAVGNRTAYTTTITNTQVTTYTYNAANQLVKAKLDTSSDTWYYEYDGNGNQTRQVPNGLTPAAGEVRYTFDQRNLLTRVETHNGTSYQLQAEVFYDGKGDRLRTVAYVAGVSLTTTYTLDNRNGATLVVSDGSESTLLLYGLFGLGEYGTEWHYYLGDATFSVRQLVAQDGDLLFTRTYDPFGGILHISGSASSLYGFAGTQGGVGGLLYINGRYFDPRTGRFLSPDGNFDPMRPGTLNGYVASNLMANPVIALLPVLAVFHWRKRRNGKGINKTDLFLLGLFVIIGLSACVGSDGDTSTPAPNPGEVATGTPVPQTSVPDSTSTSAPGTPAPTSTSQPTVEIVICPVPITASSTAPSTTTSTPTTTPTTTPTPSSTPTATPAVPPRPENIRDSTWRTYLTVRDQLLGTSDLLNDGRLSDIMILRILIRVEFNGIAGTLYETALEALSHQYDGYGCGGECSSLSQQLFWLNAMQGWYGRDGNSIPLDDCSRCEPDAIRVKNGVEVSDGYYAWWWGNPKPNSAMDNYINSDPTGRSDPPWAEIWKQNHPDREPLRGGFIIQGPIPGGGNYSRFLVVDYDQNQACGEVEGSLTCMGFQKS